MPSDPVENGNGSPEYGLVVQQTGPAQQNLVKYASLLLNYLYGFNIVLARSVSEASELLLEHGRSVRCTFAVQEKALHQTALTALSLRGSIPLILLLPEEAIAEQTPLAAGLKNVFSFPWEQVYGQNHVSLRSFVDPIFERNGIGGLFDRTRHISYHILQQRVEKRLKTLHTLPTLPEVVNCLTRLVNDPDSTAEDLEKVLRSDPAVVHKLIQVVSSAFFAGTGHRSEWTLKEAVVRLGRKKLGSIALQIRLINSLVKPEESRFDLRRFWVHSVGTAVLADKLYTDGLVPRAETLEFKDYWIAALLHDVGHLVLGFFFWSYFERLLELAAKVGLREAERALGEAITHEQVGEIMLVRAGMPEELVRAVGFHHHPEDAPPTLSCLVHLADNLAKDLGLGYLSGVRGEYSDSVLLALGLDEAKLEALRCSLAGTAVPEILELVDLCAAS